MFLSQISSKRYLEKKEEKKKGIDAAYGSNAKYYPINFIGNYFQG